MRILENNFRLFCFLLYAGVLLWIFKADGIHLDKEAVKYLGCAERLTEGNFGCITGPYKGFGAFILFLVPFVATGLPLAGILAQAALSFYAAFSLGRSVKLIGGNEMTAKVAVLVFLAMIPVQQWVLALYSESFFTSMVILLTEHTLKKEKAKPIFYLLAAVVLFARPVGILFAGPALVWKLLKSKPVTVQVTAFAAVLLIAVSLPGIPRPQLIPIVEAHVICGFPEDPGAAEGFSGSSILDAQRFLLERNGAGFTTALFFRRAGSLFVFTRPYFSDRHNLLYAPFYLLYPLAILGLFKIRRKAAVVFLMAVVLLNVALIGLTHDEWNSRFLVPLWPFILLMAAAAFFRTSDPKQHQDATFHNQRS